MSRKTSIQGGLGGRGGRRQKKGHSAYHSTARPQGRVSARAKVKTPALRAPASPACAPRVHHHAEKPNSALRGRSCAPFVRHRVTAYIPGEGPTTCRSTRSCSCAMVV